MHELLATLQSGIAAYAGGACSGGADDNSFWLRADDRFDLCVSWMPDDCFVQLSAMLPRAGFGWESTPPRLDDDAWCRASFPEGDWLHASTWHPPSSFVGLLSRAPAHALQADAFPHIVRSFIDRMVSLDRMLNGASDGHS